MKWDIYYKPPVVGQHMQSGYFFPNTTDVPLSYSGDRLTARTEFAAEYYRVLQKDLMVLMEKVYVGLSEVDYAISGRAIIYYRSQPLQSKSEARKYNLAEALFSFGVTAITDYGQCDLYLQPYKNESLTVYSSGLGIGEFIAAKVVLPYRWNVRINVEFAPQSRYGEIEARSNPGHRWYGYFGRGFNIPSHDRIGYHDDEI